MVLGVVVNQRHSVVRGVPRGTWVGSKHGGHHFCRQRSPRQSTVRGASAADRAVEVLAATRVGQVVIVTTVAPPSAALGKGKNNGCVGNGKDRRDAVAGCRVGRVAAGENDNVVRGGESRGGGGEEDECDGEEKIARESTNSVCGVRCLLTVCVLLCCCRVHTKHLAHQRLRTLRWLFGAEQGTRPPPPPPHT